MFVHYILSRRKKQERFSNTDTYKASLTPTRTKEPFNLSARV